MVRKSSRVSLSNKSTSKRKLGTSNSQTNFNKSPRVHRPTSLMKTANSTETLERVMRLVPIKTTRSKKKQQKSTTDLHRKKSKSGKSKSTIQKGVRKTQQRYKSASSVEEVFKV